MDEIMGIRHDQSARTVSGEREATSDEPVRASTGAALRLDAVEFSYGEVRALQGMSIDVHPGEFLTLLGSSGSGKTTTLGLIAGFLRPSRGEIYLDGAALTRLAPYRRNVGVVFQSYALFPHLTVFENVAFPLRVRGTPAAEVRARVEEALDLVALPGYGARRIGQLSGGQQQRVAVARAVVFRPRLLLMDEPLGALDAQLRRQMQIEFRGLQERLGVTVVYVTHDQEEALTMSDRIAVMRDGRIEQLDTPERIYDRPGTKFVAEFIGDANVLPGRVEDVVGPEVKLRVGPLAVRSVTDQVVRPGQTVAVAIRPERFEVDSRDGDIGALANSTSGKVVDAFFSGDRRLLTVELAGALRIVVKQSAAARRRAVRRGEEVIVGWAAEDTLVFPENS